MLGIVGLSLSIFSYFLIDRDVETRRHIDDLNKAVHELELSDKQHEVEARLTERDIGRTYEIVRTDSERITRLEISLGNKK
jgi:hypothetical protein